GGMKIRDGAGPIEDGVARPARPALRNCQGDGGELTFPLEGSEIKDAGAIAKAAVSLLKGDHIGLDFLDDRQRPVRVEATLAPYALVNVVRGDESALFSALHMRAKGFALLAKR